MFNNLSYSFDQLILSSSSFSVSYLPICQLLFPVHSYFGELLLFVFRFGDLLLFFSFNFIYMTLFSICSAIVPNSVSFSNLISAASLSSCSNSLSSAPTYSNFYMTLFSSYLVLPLYSTISFYVLSFDVIHSFGYHSFGFKSDAIPGRVNSVAALSFFVPGFFSSYCYELCGSSHTSMLSSVIVLS